MARTPFGAGALLAVIAVLVMFVAPGAALAASAEVKLALTPVGSAGLYFDVEMRPGATRALAVDLSNDGEVSIAARTYAADVYTIVNGGFGDLMRGDAQTGTTKWLDYPNETLELPAGQSIRLLFTVAVPADTRPGEYVTSIVLENDQPVSGGGKVSLSQIFRTAIAVAVTVPGPRLPSLTIGAATYAIVAGRSVVTVAVENDGNVRLKPEVTFVLLDASGSKVGGAGFQMGTFYAHTGTFVEIPVTAILAPGAYTLQLGLEDAAQDVRVDSAGIPLVVGAASEAAVGAAGTAKASADNGAPAGSTPLGGLLVALVTGIAIGGVLIGGSLLAVSRHRRRSTAEK